MCACLLSREEEIVKKIKNESVENRVREELKGLRDNERVGVI